MSVEHNATLLVRATHLGASPDLMQFSLYLFKRQAGLELFFLAP